MVAVKIGASESSRAAALAHTGSLAGSAEAFEAVAGSAGVVRFDSFEDAIEAVEFLARQPLPRGRNIAVMTNSGALRSLITEAADRTGATLASLSDATAASLGAILEQPTSPIRSTPSAPFREQQYAACLDALVDAPEVDIVLTAEELPRDDGVERRVANLRVDSKASRGAPQPRQARGGVHAAPGRARPTTAARCAREIPHVPVMRGIERTLRIVARWRKPARGRSMPDRSSPRRPTPTSPDAGAPAPRRSIGPTALNEVESKSLLRRLRHSAAAGAPGPDRRRGGRRRRRQIGFPVVLKAVSAAMPHKSDAGLVLLNLHDADAVRQAAAAIAGARRRPAAPLDGMLVAQQISGGTEAVLGVSATPRWARS